MPWYVKILFCYSGRSDLLYCRMFYNVNFLIVILCIINNEFWISEVFQSFVMNDFNPLDVTLLYVVTGSPCCKGTRGTSWTPHQGKNLILKQSPGDLNPYFNWSLTLTTPQLDKISCSTPSKAYTTTYTAAVRTTTHLQTRVCKIYLKSLSRIIILTTPHTRYY